MEHEGHRERMRERFLKTNLEGFAPHEALELLLSFSIPRRDTNPIAHELIRHFGSLHRILEATPEELTQVKGIGETSATLIALVLPLTRAYAQSKATEKPTLNTVSACKAYARSLLMGERVEHFEVIALDSSFRLISKERIASGNEGETSISPRKVMAFLLRCGAARTVIAHNHPDGAVDPSLADQQLTAALKSLMSGVHIALYDHIIIGGMASYSFRENGLLP